MASSQVEIASSAPFGRVLMDHNQRDVCTESNAHSSFQNNLHSLVRDHLHGCISISSDSEPNENSLHQMNNIDNWVRSQEKTALNNFRFAGGPANPSTTSPVKSRMPEHWAAKQTQMVSGVAQNHLHSYLCETMPDTDQNNSRAFPTEQLTSRKDQSLPTSFKISNLGASSLVQLWEKRLNQTHNVNSNPSMINVDSPSACNSELSHPDNTCPAKVAGDLSYERFDGSESNNDSIALPDWQSNTTPNIPTSVSQDTNSKSGEKERVRVADIIRRLIAVTQTQSPLSSWKEENDLLNDAACRDPAEHRRLSKVISSPRLRGRQAFADLLMQIERDRNRELGALVERHAVSKFSHRGRIQSMLRLRLLQRGFEVVGQRHLLGSVAAEATRFGEASAIHMSQRFTTEHKSGKASNLNNHCRESVANRLPLDSCSASFQSNQCDHCEQQVDVIQGLSPIPGHGSVSADVPQHHQEKEEVGPSSNCSWNQTSLQSHILDSTGTPNSMSLIEDWDEMSEEDDDEGDSPTDTAANFDWFNDISRPRSYWEDRRKEWYQEILSTGSDNEDIRQLLERKTVSNFLVSDFRERMDRLMVHRLEQQVQHEEEQDEENHGRLEQFQCFPHRLAHTEGRNENEGGGGGEGEEKEEEEVEQENEEEEEEEAQDQEQEAEEAEEESLGSGPYQELTYYLDQSISSLELPSPSRLRSWSFQDNEVSNNSERVASTISPLAPPSQSSNQDNSQQCSPSMINNCPSPGMEAMYNMRKQMEQLYEEMSELRKSINRCTKMQLDLQQSLKHQVNNNPCQEVMRKRQCCICYEMQVDSLLYRCGHMCTCLKCAHELQWSSGNCPICRAPIVDVVRAYIDS